MRSERSLLFRVLALLLALAVVATACGSDGDDDGETASDAVEESSAADTDDGEVAAGDLTGEFLVSGSSTVFPIVNKQAEEFGAANPGVAIAVEGPGSGDGAVLFCDGDIPIGNASRRYKDSARELCRQRHRVHRAASCHRRHLGRHLGRERRHRVPELRPSVRPHLR